MGIKERFYLALQLRVYGTSQSWECFSTPAEAGASAKQSAKQLVRQGETYVTEKHDEACPRCQAAVQAKSMLGIFNEASA
jgi:hypothetical protein